MFNYGVLFHLLHIFYYFFLDRSKQTNWLVLNNLLVACLFDLMVSDISFLFSSVFTFVSVYDFVINGGPRGSVTYLHQMNSSLSCFIYLTVAYIHEKNAFQVTLLFLLRTLYLNIHNDNFNSECLF